MSRILPPSLSPEELGWTIPPAPGGWVRSAVRGDGAAYSCLPRKLGVILSASLEQDGKRWVHLSLSHRHRVPTWGELRATKEAFLGDVYAVTVLPPQRVYINIHPKVLHLFHCLDGHPLPEFSRGMGSL